MLVNGAVINPVLLVQIGGITAPGYRGLSFRTYDQLFYTTYLGILYQMSTTTLALGNQFQPPLPYASFTIPISFQFNRVSIGSPGGDLVYWYTATSTTFKQIYSYNTSTATVNFNNVLYPQGIDPILTAWYGSSVFQYTTGFITQTFTSGEMTTGLTTSSITTGSATTSRPITSSPMTTARVATTAALTSGLITTGVGLTSGKITTGIGVTTGRSTTGRSTTGSVSTTRAPTTGITTQSVTTGTTTGPPVISKFTSYVAVSVALLVSLFIMIIVIGIIMIPAAANYVGLYDLPSETF